jgi:chaperone required for assembly of F1-ATPase
MGEWALKRFWKETTTDEKDGQFAVLLDGRPVKTPAKAALAVPTRALADAIAAEWDAQEKEVNPNVMPFTRMANAAIDKVTIQHGEVAQMLADYGDSDLLCYRAERSESLVDRQAAEWDPALDWAADALGARLQARAGVIHVAQEPAALQTLAQRVHDLDKFRLAAFHDLVTLSGSLVLGFAAAEGWKDPDSIWDISMLDTLWQEEQWGRDEEAYEAAQVKRAAFRHAKTFYDFSGAR